MAETFGRMDTGARPRGSAALFMGPGGCRKMSAHGHSLPFSQRVAAASRVYLTAPSAAQGREFLSLVRQSPQPTWSLGHSPATAAAFRAYLEALVPGDASVAGCAAERMTRWSVQPEPDLHGGFQSAYLATTPFAPAAGRGPMSAGLHLLLGGRSSAAELRSGRALQGNCEANIQPENTPRSPGAGLRLHAGRLSRR